jgi:hypothetical protein
MPSTRTPIGSRAEQALLAVLPPSVNVRRVGSGDGIDVIVNGQPIQIKWLGEGRLGEVRRLLADRRGRPDVVVARRLSPGARAELADAGVGWVDETGAAEIVIGQIVVSRSGVERESPRPQGWTRSALAIAEAALCGVAATVSAMQDATGLSTGSCVTALQVLSDLGLLEATAARGRESARRVADPDRLLDAYAAAAPALASQARLEVGVTWRDLVAGVRSVGRRWTDDGTEFAVTGQLGAELMAPYLTAVSTAEVYVSAETSLGLEAAAATAGLKPIEGGRLVLRPFPSVSVSRLATSINGLRVAPWPRVYVDLLGAGVRGEDAAEHLKDTVRER